MREVIKPGLVLFIVTLVAAVCLGAVYGITKEPIEQQQLMTRNLALKELLPEAAEFTEVTLPAGGLGSVQSCFAGLANAAEAKPSVELASFGAYAGANTMAGYVLGVTTTGYAGPIDLMAAFDDKGTILGIKILNHSETPGLGALAKNAAFTDLFVGKAGELTVTKTGGGDNTIDAITSATITTKAVVDGVNAATEFYSKYLGVK